MRRMSNGAFESRGTIDSNSCFARGGSSSHGMTRRRLPDVRRQIRQESPDLVERVLLVFRDVVDDAALRVNLDAAEFFLRRLTPSARSTSAGPPISTCAVCRVITAKCDATKRPAGNPATAPSAADAIGTCAERIGDHLETRLGEYRFADGTAFAAATAHTAAATFEQTHQRHAILDREMFGVDALAQTRGVRRAALQREVFAADDDATTRNFAEADDIVGRNEVVDLVPERSAE